MTEFVDEDFLLPRQDSQGHHNEHSDTFNEFLQVELLIDLYLSLIDDALVLLVSPGETHVCEEG